MQEGARSSRGVLWLVAALIVAAGLVGAAYVQSQKPTEAAAKELAEAQVALKKQQAGLEELKAKSAVVFLGQAKLAAVEWRYGEALNAVQRATEADPSLAQAWLLQAQLLAVQEDHDQAAEAAEQYHKLRPGDATGEKLLALCQDAARTEFPNPNWELAKIFREQGQRRLAEALLQALEGKYAVYRRRLEDAGLKAPWLDGAYRLRINLRYYRDLTDISVLEGIPLHEAGLCGTAVADLSPLTGMPLRSLTLGETKVSDLSPLAGMPLESLNLYKTAVADLSPLKGMPLKSRNLVNCGKVLDLSPLAGMPLEDLNLYHMSVTDWAPLEGMPLKRLSANCIPDLRPLAGMELERLERVHGGQDLTALQDMPLKRLGVTGATNLEALRGLAIESLQLFACGHLRDLSPLRDLPLKRLEIHQTQTPDVSGLAGLKLEYLQFDPRTVAKGMEALRAMTSLGSIGGNTAKDFWRRYDAGEFKPYPSVARPAPPTHPAPRPTQPVPQPPAREPTEAEKRLVEYRARLTEAWPDLMKKAPNCLRLNKEGKLLLHLIGAKVEDLTPLAGLPIAELSLSRSFHGSPVKSLKPLEGVPLQVVRLKACHALKSLDGLQGAKLTQTSLDLGACKRLEDISALKGQNLTNIGLYACESLKSLKGLEGMKLERIDLRFCRGLEDISALKGAPLTTLDLDGCLALPSLRGLEGMKLTKLNAHQCNKLTDISALKGLPLTELNLRFGAVADISALAGMPLKRLTLNGNVKDLTPLRGMGLEELTSIEAPDLSPLKGMPLKRLMFIADGATDLSPLKGAPLEHVFFWGCKNLQDLSPLQGSPLKELHFTHSTRQPDLSVLADLKLEKLEFDPTQVTEKGLAALRAMDSLQQINPSAAWIDAADFWKRYDAGEFRRPPIHTALKAANPGYGEWGWFPTENGKIVEANLQKCQITDLSPLKGLPIRSLDCRSNPITDLSPLQGMPLRFLDIRSTKVTDLTPLADSGMEHFRFSPKAIKKGMDILRGLKTLQTIAVDDGKPMAVAEFWKKYDAGKFR